MSSLNKADELEIGKEYNLKGKIVRYIGIGKHTNQLMFQDNISGNIIFELQMKEEIIYVE